ncbi:MAG: right-handed parallel beta-helix repeat-containing protein [Phycisphaerales bacterium]|nr:right-handed parallel beta-helix repeat-containing protein [Phycisphaerales bacterium]
MTRADDIRYVDSTASGDNDGSSWTNAFTSLGTAIDAAGSTWVIRVAQGSYGPGAAQSSTFLIDTDGVEIYGGYGGLQEQDPDERDIVDFETILTGVVASNPPSITRAWHVVKFTSNVGTTTILDGVTIIGGDANREGEQYAADRNGGGIWVEKGEPVVSYCTIKNNEADNWGGGVYMQGDSNAAGDDAVFIGCTFDNNTAVAHGGGMLTEARIDITDCVFKNNDCTAINVLENYYDGGGGLWIAPGHNGAGDYSVLLTGCNFLDNTAAQVGGGWPWRRRQDRRPC